MFDVIVIGVGSMGASAAYHMAKQGVKVLGIEQFEIAHEQGSHSGQSRIVRKAYFEHPDYVPLLEGAYKGWKHLEEETGQKFYFPSGIAYLGEPDHFVMAGIKESARMYNILLDTLTKTQSAAFNVPKNFEQLIEPDSGFALTDQTIKTYSELAKKLGVVIKTGEVVKGWKLKEGEVEVTTSENVYRASKIIITAGAYTKELVPKLDKELKVTRQFLSWVKPAKEELFQLDNFPCWMISDKAHPGIFYGFPILPQKEFGGNGLMKVGHHLPGEEIEIKDLHAFDACEEVEKLTNILNQFIPEALGEIVTTSVCMYNNTPDEHFIIDYLPDSNQQVVIASGFCGHGFKFVPVIGEILADLAMKEETDWPIDFLRWGRF